MVTRKYGPAMKSKLGTLVEQKRVSAKKQWSWEMVVQKYGRVVKQKHGMVVHQNAHQLTHTPRFNTTNAMVSDSTWSK
jgi:hypothetical protein